MSIAFELYLLEDSSVDSFKRNIVATVNLDCRLDLKTIALHARNAEYNPKVRAQQPPMACDLAADIPPSVSPP